MTYEVTSQSNNYSVSESPDEAGSLGEFLRSLALGLGAVVVTSVAVYLAVFLLMGLSLGGLN
jgi:hypothetical protein